MDALCSTSFSSSSWIASDFHWQPPRRKLLICKLGSGSILETAVDSSSKQPGGGKQPTRFLAELLRRCGNSRDLSEGKRLHGLMKSAEQDRETLLGNLLVQMYGKCGKVEEARIAFDRIRQRNVFSWTIMILACIQNGLFREALDAYQEMRSVDAQVEPDAFIFSNALGACAALGALAEGKAIHLELVARGGYESRHSIVATALVDMYAKCGSLEEARRVFDKMQQRDVVSWGAILTGYSKLGDGRATLELYRRMDLEGTEPNAYAFASVLDACAGLGALAEGRAVHARTVRVGLETDVVVATALVNMYAECGRMEDAREAFDKVASKDLVCWNSLVAAYAQHGHGEDALELFQEMSLQPVELNHVTFTSILHACSHTGLLEQGRNYFVSMSLDHGIAPRIDHYVRMIDLLGRAGWLEEAEELIARMPFQPNNIVWMTLLGSYRMHGHVQHAAAAADRVLELEPDHASGYVLLSNIYARAGRWDDVRKVRRAMKANGVKKPPGQSYIEVRNRVHEFGVGDRSHPRNCEIRAELQRLNKKMREAGYVPDTREVLRDVETMEEKVELLSYHSERLAIAFGLIATDPGTPLCIVKNLRVCSDCHAATKFISKIVNRVIVVRDANRYHRFEQGLCSCKDYW